MYIPSIIIYYFYYNIGHFYPDYPELQATGCCFVVNFINEGLKCFGFLVMQNRNNGEST